MKSWGFRLASARPQKLYPIWMTKEIQILEFAHLDPGSDKAQGQKNNAIPSPTGTTSEGASFAKMLAGIPFHVFRVLEPLQQILHVMWRMEGGQNIDLCKAIRLTDRFGGGLFSSSALPLRQLPWLQKMAQREDGMLFEEHKW